ncbi:hypothetical protein DCS_01583 [Drechmeria coniospora]|uniref:Uncharacterized protein n=1 Tax=Drechmeria coniospora TaxID=98403 RepID=A0A151GTJ9_DRECN|nr:hypothetical protein DCS_01583 [Drechmeria coniospora]KYK60446.1 hypothetical protein DCS_01583 [Drechmeria coniospora]
MHPLPASHRLSSPYGAPVSRSPSRDSAWRPCPASPPHSARLLSYARRHHNSRVCAYALIATAATVRQAVEEADQRRQSRRQTSGDGRGRQAAGRRPSNGSSSDDNGLWAETRVHRRTPRTLSQHPPVLFALLAIPSRPPPSRGFVVQSAIIIHQYALPDEITVNLALGAGHGSAWLTSKSRDLTQGLNCLTPKRLRDVLHRPRQISAE